MDGFDPDPTGTPFDQKSDWSTTVYHYIKCGDSWVLHGGFSRSKNRWHGLARPTGSDFQSYDSLDQVIDLYVEAVVTENENSVAHPQIDLEFRPGYFTNAGTWVAGLVNGQTYNGADDWDQYAEHTIDISFFDWDRTNVVVMLANTPQVVSAWGFSYSGGDAKTNDKQDELFRNGLGFRTTLYDPGGVQPDVINVTAVVSLLRVRYFNAVVNSLSKSHAGTAGGEEVVLTGINFDPSDADLEEHANGAPGVWNAEVARIYFEKVPGVPDYTLLPGAGADKFVINSDGQITMTLPAMVAGNYFVRLRKINVAGGVGTVDSYVGDFTANEDGLVKAGTRLAFAIGDAFVPPTETQPLILTDWRWKNKAGDIALRSYSPIDAPSPLVFYDGRLISISSLKRGVDDNTGAFSISDMTATIANHDKEISKLLADYFLKNQIVDIYQHFGSEPYADKTSIHKVIVEDYSLEGTSFPVTLKDITRKYFSVKVPRFRCTEEEFTNIHDSAKGRAMQEILGLCSVTGVTAPGAVEAWYIDTVNFKYLAARGSLFAVDEVYSDGELRAEGVDYDIVYADGGRTYIDFVNDQEDNKVTFNCKGYEYDTLYDWNSGNGYVQNPIYIQLFLLAFIAEIPWELLDLASFDTLAALFVTNGWDESGHFILQDETDLDEALKGLLYTCGNFGFIAIDGRFKVVKKSIDDYESTSVRIFDQIDLMRPAKRTYGFQSAVNYIQAIYDFYPAPNQFYGSLEDKRESSIDDLEAEIEPGSRAEFPWTNSLSLIQDRLTEILLKRGYGDNRITFSVSIKWFKRLDLMMNFKFQDLWGLSTTGGGEEGRIYYIISLNYNWTAATIDVEAVDLQWLLRQFFIIGDSSVLPENWSLYSEIQRIFGAVCDSDTGEFDDGEPGKMV